MNEKEILKLFEFLKIFNEKQYCEHLRNEFGVFPGRFYKEVFGRLLIAFSECHHEPIQGELIFLYKFILIIIINYLIQKN